MTRMFILVAVLLLILALGIHWGEALMGEKGYVLIAFSHWKIELTVFSAIFFLLGSYFTVWLFLKIVRYILTVAGVSKDWFAQLTTRGRERKFYNGMLAYLNQDDSEAEKHLQGLDGSDWNGVSWLTLANIAEQNHDTEAQLSYLIKASELSASKKVANTALIKFYLKHNRHDDAERMLDSLPKAEQLLPTNLQSRAQSMFSSSSWSALNAFLDTHRKRLPSAFYASMKGNAIQHEFAEIASKSGAHALKEFWAAAPRKQKNDATYQTAYIAQLLSQDMHHEAEDMLLKHLKAPFSEEFLRLCQRIKLKDPSKILSRLEDGLKSDENNVQLLSCLTQVAINAGDFDLAERALNKLIKLNSSPEVLKKMALVKAKQNDLPAAISFYEKLV